MARRSAERSSKSPATHFVVELSAASLQDYHGAVIAWGCDVSAVGTDRDGLDVKALPDQIGLYLHLTLAIPHVDRTITAAEQMATIRCETHAPVDFLALHHRQLLTFGQIPNLDVVPIADGQDDSVRETAQQLARMHANG